MAGEIQLNSTTFATESAGTVTIANVDSATNRTNLGLGSIATQASDSIDIDGGSIDGTTIGGGSAAAGTFTTFTSTGIDDNASSTALTIDSSGNVGIGSNSPSTDGLTGGLVIGDGTSNDGITLFGSTTSQQNIAFTDTAGNQQGLIQYDHSGDYIRFFTSSTERMRIDSSGNIGAPSGTNIYNASDERLKQNITDLSGCLQKVLLMRGVSFNWIDEFCDSEADKTLYGLIAQELQIVDSNLVDSFSDNTITAGSVTVENPLRVNEKFIIPMLVESIKEQQTIIESQQSQIDALTARIEALETA